MPHVILADAEKFSIYKTIESKVKLPVAYRTRQCDMLSVPESTSFTWRRSVKTASEKPRFIIVGFQAATDGDQTKIPFTIDHVNLKNAYVMLNSDRCPVIDYNLSFSNQKFSRVYGGAALFGVKFFGMDELITKSAAFHSKTESTNSNELFSKMKENILESLAKFKDKEVIGDSVQF